MPSPDIYDQRRISMLSPELRERVFHNLITHQFLKAGCTRADGKPWPEWFQRLPVERHRVFTSTPERGTYNHHAGVCGWRGKYWYVFSNCLKDEDVPGQRTMIARSDDLGKWSEPVCVAAGDIPGDMWRGTGGVFAAQDRLFVCVMTMAGHYLTRKPGMSTTEVTKTRHRISFFLSTDGAAWAEHRVMDDCWWFEPPRPTREGRLLCPGSLSNGQPIVLLWPGDDPLASPEVVLVPHDTARGLDAGHFPYGEATWYETADGLIFLFHRNETDELRLRVAVSADAGRSWTQPMLSDIPDSMSRVSAGRLADGRFYLIGNAIADLLNRIPLMISVSDDGCKFDRQFVLIDEPAEISFPGALKAHGHQYPATFVEENRLVVAYSVNKEHMEVLSLDTRKIPPRESR
ncbi:MAG: exo-alpha-sialidase [Planctomycetota bacterium]